VPHATKQGEARSIREQIEAAGPDRDFKDMAVLYRCNHQSRPIEDELIKAAIPYAIIGGFGFYGRREIQDMIAYMEVVVRGDDSDNDEFFNRIYSRQTRYIGKKFLNAYDRAKDTEGAISCLTTHPWSWPAVSRRSEVGVRLFGKDLQRLRRDHFDSPTGFLRYIRNDMGYDEWFLNDVGEEANVDRDDVLSNLNELLAAAENFRTIESMLKFIRDCLRKQEKDKENKNKVLLMTMHSAKGLEFPLVFVAGIHEDLVPHVKSENIPEERRLLYVGITRAKEDCRLSYYIEHQSHQVGASPFLDEMDIAPSVETVPVVA